MKMLHCLYFSLLAILLSSCTSGSFNRDWKAAVAEFEETGASDQAPFLGPWTGSWNSHLNGHEGDLRCLVSPVDAGGDTTYEFRYHATWGDFFQGGYRADYEVTRDGNRGYLVKGSKDMGLFGSFDHEGWILGEKFDATFASDSGDHGEFELARPGQED